MPSNTPWAFYDPDGSCLRTSAPSLLDDLDSMWSSLDLPASGCLHSGRVYALPMLGRPTVESGGSLSVTVFSTPDTAPEAPNAGSNMTSRPAGLGNQVKALLPTPAVNDMGEGKSPEHWDAWTAKMQARHGNGHGKSLAIEAQRLLPTPTVGDAANAANKTAARSDPDSTHHDGTTLVDATRLLPTPRAQADRASRSSLTKDGHWSAPSLGQAVELAQGILPREFESWDEVNGWHGATTPPPSPDGSTSSDGPHQPPLTSAADCLRVSWSS